MVTRERVYSMLLYGCIVIIGWASLMLDSDGNR